MLALALAGCDQPADDTNIVIDNNVSTAEAANADVAALPPSESPVAPVNNSNAVDNPAPSVATKVAIPAQYRGRWGLVAADCTSTRGDAKGLITVGDTSIRFYESTATLKEPRPAIATSFAGRFSFTGEGQKWDKVVTFTRTGNSLKRADDEGSFTYTRCA